MDDFYEPNPVDIEDPLGPKLALWRKEASQQYILEPGLEGDTTVNLDEAALNDAEIREKYYRTLGDVKCALIDLDGTLFNIRLDDTAPTPSALEAFAKYIRILFQC